MVDRKIQHLRADMSTAYFFDHHATPEDLAVVVTERDFLAAQQELVPSVSQGELQHYEKVRATFEGSGSEKKADNGRGKAIESGGPQDKGKDLDKGKGKAVDYSYDDGEASGTVRRKRDKGKGKAVAGFEDGTASDDDGLY
jgi:peroxin-6